MGWAAQWLWMKGWQETSCCFPFYLLQCKANASGPKRRALAPNGYDQMIINTGEGEGDNKTETCPQIQDVFVGTLNQLNNLNHSFSQSINPCQSVNLSMTLNKSMKNNHNQYIYVSQSISQSISISQWISRKFQNFGKTERGGVERGKIKGEADDTK